MCKANWLPTPNELILDNTVTIVLAIQSKNTF